MGNIELFHSRFKSLLFPTLEADPPYCYRCPLNLTYPSCQMACLDPIERILKEHHRELAGFIIEPLVQAAAGMLTSPPGYLKRIRELCTKYDVLLIADEVATGFGRTGKMFACQHEGVTPDLMAISKGLTGGYMPLAATLTTDDIYQAFLGKYEDFKTFFHGHSYTGNPLGCAVALANLEVFKKEKTLSRLQPKIKTMARLRYAHSDDCLMWEISGSGDSSRLSSWWRIRRHRNPIRSKLEIGPSSGDGCTPPRPFAAPDRQRDDPHAAAQHVTSGTQTHGGNAARFHRSRHLTPIGIVKCIVVQIHETSTRAPFPTLRRSAADASFTKISSRPSLLMERGRLFRRPFAITAHECLDLVAGNTDLRVGSLRDVSNFLHVVGGQVGNQIAESINVDDLPYQRHGFPFRLEIVKVLQSSMSRPKDANGCCLVSHAAAGAKRSRPSNVWPGDISR